MFRCVLVVMMLVACSSGPSRGPREPSSRAQIARRELPAELASLVPAHGVYLAGGGEKSPVFRVIVDTDANTIVSGTAPPASPIHGKLTEERTRELTPRNEEHLTRLCADTRSEPPPVQEPEPVAGYDEYLVIADGDAVFFLHQRGPIQRPAAVRAIEALRAAAAL